MEQSVRKSIAAFVHLFAILGLVLMAACSNPTQVPNPQATATPTSEPVVLNTVAVPTPVPTVSGDVTAINFTAANFNVVMSFSVYGSRDVNLSALATAFMKIHPEIKVNFSTEYEWSLNGNDFQKLSQENDC